MRDFSHKWLILIASFTVMMVISVYQYSWFLFAFTIHKEYQWELPTVSLTFTVFTYSATLIQPFSGFVADSYGPKKVALVASFLVGIGFILSSLASSPFILYCFYGLGGIGVGILYGISTACAVKWFPENRGLATGFVVFGFGAGTAIFNWFIQQLLEGKGISTTFLYLGCSMLMILFPLSFSYKYPKHPSLRTVPMGDRSEKVTQDFTPLKMLKTSQWSLIYFSFIVTVSVVLLFGAQMKMLAKEFNLPSKYFNLLLVLFPLGNGLSRLFSGTISDRIGRETTMTLFYLLLGLSMIALFALGHSPIAFVSIVFIAALLGGAPFALYPATIGDYFGSQFSTTNYGITYTAKAWAGLIAGWFSSYLVLTFGSFRIPIVILAACCLLAAGLSNPKLLKAPKAAVKESV